MVRMLKSKRESEMYLDNIISNSRSKTIDFLENRWLEIMGYNASLVNLVAAYVSRQDGRLFSTHLLVGIIAPLYSSLMKTLIYKKDQAK